MARFKYLAYSKDQKQLVGYMNSETIETARAELHSLGLSILTIEPTTEDQEQPSSGKQTFEFEASDKTSKRLVGTIDAESLFKAYLRLVDEYKFRIYWLVDASLSEIEKEQQKNAGLIELETQYQQYREEEERKRTPLFKRIFGTTNLKDIQKNIEVIQQQTEAVIKKAQEALEIMGTDIPPDARVMIKQKIDELLILKTSTNTDRLQILANDLLRLVKEQQNFLKKQGITENQESLSKLNTIFQDMYSFSRFRDIKVDFGSLGKVIAKVQSAIQTLKVNREEQKSEELLKKEGIIQELKQKIKTGYTNLRTRFQVFFKLFASGKSKLLQEETWQDIRSLWKQIQKHKADIKFLEKEVISIKKQRKRMSIERLDLLGLHFIKLSTILYESKIFIHWLLLFYTCYFLLASLVIRFSYEPLLPFAQESLLSTPLLSYIIIFLLLLYTALSFHTGVFRKQPFLSILWSAASLVLFVIFLVNF